jgi:hypothetical protein
VLFILLACTLTPAVPPTRESGGDLPTAAPEPFAAESDGPPGFSASLSAPDIVMLTWEAVAESVGYELQLVFDATDPITIARLPAGATAYEHFMAPESSLLTYRLQTITADGPAGASSLQIATQARRPDPLTVQPSYAEDQAVTATIDAAGGTIEATDSRGVTYSLAIPPGALQTDLEIAMTPVSAVDGWPLDGSFLGAVRLQPEGWLLDEAADLTIDLPAALAGGASPVGFAFDGAGAEFHLAPAYSGSESLGGRPIGLARLQARTVIRLPVMELKVSGVGGTSVDASSAIARDHAPTDGHAAADQKTAAQKRYDDELAPLMTPAQLGAQITGQLLDTIANVSDCWRFKQATHAFETWESKTAELGDGYPDRSIDRQLLIDHLADKAIEVIEKAAEDCQEAEQGVIPDSVPCAEKLIQDMNTGRNDFYKDLDKAAKRNAESWDRLVAAQDALNKCPHSFRVDETPAFGFQWKSGCIPSLDRPFQVRWVDMQGMGVYRLYPRGPLSGRLEGNSVMDIGSAGTATTVYEGTYTIDVRATDANGYPTRLDGSIEFTATTTICSAGSCLTTSSDGSHLIPLVVNGMRCPIP